MKKKVCAVIVTYNRLPLLKECLAKVKAQKYRDFDILVVNNGSTDGTTEYLQSTDNIIVINQANLGGAGGFYTGMKYAQDNGYEWVWLMDDDGLPSESQLDELITWSQDGTNKVLNALVVSKDDHTRLAFGKREPLSSLPNENLLTKPISPFNGTFIHRDVWQKIGLIKREMFIWGDEQEYFCRLAKAGFKAYTVKNAIHYHPFEKGMKTFALPFVDKGKIILKPKKMSHYYYRNIGYINKNYRGATSHLKALLYYTVYFTRTLDFAELDKFFKYYFRGVNNNYN